MKKLISKLFQNRRKSSSFTRELSTDSQLASDPKNKDHLPPGRILGQAGTVSDGHGLKFCEPKTSGELHHRLTTLESIYDVNRWFRNAFSPQQLAEIAMLRSAKSDFILAKKLLVQADVASICEGWALDAYNELCIRERELDSLALEDVEAESSPFEFLIVHSGQGGTTAVQNFLCLHPELIVTQKSEMDYAVENGQEQALAKKYKRRIAAASVPVHAGMVQHGYVVGMQGWPETVGLHLGPKNVERLAKIVCRKRFHHLVRDPFEVLRFGYNNRIVHQFAGGYKFPGSMNYPSDGRLSYGPTLSWPSTWDIPAAGLPRCWAESRSRNMNRETAQPKLAIDAVECYLVVRHTFDRLKYAAVGEAYSRCFAEWIPIDAAELSPGKSQQGMSRLFHEFGVNSDYWHPIFETRALSSVRRAMLSNAINLTGLDHPLYVLLDYTGQALYSHTFPFIELTTLEPNHQWEDAGFANQPISLVVNFEQWVLQSSQTRKRLLTEGIFQFILEKVAIPAWIDCHNAWTCATGDHFIDDWQQLIERGICTLADVRYHIGNDIGRFLEVHPNFYRKWPSIEEIL